MSYVQGLETPHTLASLVLLNNKVLKKYNFKGNIKNIQDSK